MFPTTPVQLPRTWARGSVTGLVVLNPPLTYSLFLRLDPHGKNNVPYCQTRTQPSQQVRQISPMFGNETSTLHPMILRCQVQVFQSGVQGQTLFISFHLFFCALNYAPFLGIEPKIELRPDTYGFPPLYIVCIVSSIDTDAIAQTLSTVAQDKGPRKVFAYSFRWIVGIVQKRRIPAA